ncbi:MAG: hypothetical protein KY394_01840 [Actinobacteria bacterium]|nr:hypothetical protein [Actinomycetota bacterium]
MKFALILMVALLAACGEAGDVVQTTGPNETTITETTEDDTDPEHEAEFAPVIEPARADLATRLGVEESSIEVATAEAVTWSDGSLGCPQPGMFYTQALVEGSRVVLRHDDRFYDYHAGADDEPFLCESDAEDGGHDSVPPVEGTASM